MALVCQPWPPDLTCLPPGWSNNPDEWTVAQQTSFAIAQKLLTRMTAGKIGLCEITLRPCRRHCAEGQGYRLSTMGVGRTGVGWAPLLMGGRVWNVACGCGGPCGCGPICEVRLQGRVHQVIQVLIDGAVVPPAEYTVQAPNLLVRKGGSGCWPECQALDLPDTQPGTWSVTYLRGTAPDAAASRFVTMLAAELSAPCEKRPCNLPKRVTSIVRDGVTYTLLDDLSIFDKGRTGIAEIDMWIAAINPRGARSGMKVYSPDLPQHRRQIWP